MRKSDVLGAIYSYLYHSTDIPEEDLVAVTEDLLHICEMSGMKAPITGRCPVLLTETHTWQDEEEA